MNKRDWKIIGYGFVTFLAGVAIGMLIVSTAHAGQAKTFTWDAPTTSSEGGQCTETGPVIAPEDLARIYYKFQWREKGFTAWNSTEVSTATATITLPFGTIAEVRVAAQTPTAPALCYSDILEIQTDAGPAPGACSGLKEVE